MKILGEFIFFLLFLFDDMQKSTIFAIDFTTYTLAHINFISSKMTRSTFRGLFVCLSAISLASCQEYDGGFSESQIKEAAYAKNFVKAFGEIDPNQNWDLFGQMANGGVSRSLTRAGGTITVTDLGESYYMDIFQEDATAYQKMLPESNAREREYAETNLGRVTQNFSAYTTELTLYPIWWNTDGSDVIGIYYYSDSSDTNATEVTGTDGKKYYIVKTQVYANKTHIRAWRWGTTWINPGSESNIGTVWGWSDISYMQSMPIKVTIPSSVGKIGFYIDNAGNVSYSESKLNAKVTFSDEGQKEACFVATYVDTDASGNQVTDSDGKPVRYLCFEDWMVGATNFDLNDIVFRVYGLDEGGSKIVDEDEYDETAILVCEDLGDFDYDYNDVVLKLNYREHETKTYNRDAQGNVTSVSSSGVEKSFSITAMAAGGANKSDVYYGSTKWGEIHELLGGSAPTIINADDEMGDEGETITLTGTDVPTYSRTTTKFLSQVFSNGYIQIKTYSNGRNESDDAANLLTSDGYKTTGAPMMILLPADYLWCQEKKFIEDVYPGFTEWVGDATLTNWLSSRSSGNGLFTDRVVPVVSENVPPVVDDDDDSDGGNPGGGNQDISCPVSSITSVTTSWGSTANGQTISIPSENVSVGDKLIITSSNNGNKDFGTGWGNSSYNQGHTTELTINEAMIGATIYVTLYVETEITAAVVRKSN